MTDVRVDRLPATPYLGRTEDGWAIFAPPPGVRDLGSPDCWDRSLERSRARRAQREANKPSLPRATATRVTAAVMAASVLGTTAAADVATAAPTGQTSGEGLKRGARGDEVSALQRALGLAPDGVFGPQTARAVKRYQRSHGLVADGIVGPNTRASLGLGTGSGASGGGKASASSLGRASSSSAPSRFTVPSSTAVAVQRVIGVPADGEFGPQSRAALKRWQRAHGLTADGIPGPQTLSAMGLDGVRPARALAAGTSEGSSGSSSSSGSGLSAAISSARAAIGTPYGYGGNGPGSYDCSGLTVHAMAAAGISLPRTSQAQFGSGSAVSRANIQAGDLVFFNTAGAGASHVGIATGSSSVISATSHGVMEHSIDDPYWSAHYVGARRVG